jgi:hypothetical protein
MVSRNQFICPSPVPARCPPPFAEPSLYDALMLATAISQHRAPAEVQAREVLGTPVCLACEATVPYLSFDPQMYQRLI